ncbi:hypothetical protein LCGC14_1639050 [marine sediment metagenome]|uniref:Uncharacterized protein n=1 Tax=marine sediment metagenome TaxID=412755 RepID=A0A0F9I040_9ZZZZ
MATPVSNKIESTLKVMLNELKDECLACIKLINQLELDIYPKNKLMNC